MSKLSRYISNCRSIKTITFRIKDDLSLTKRTAYNSRDYKKSIYKPYFDFKFQYDTYNLYSTKKFMKYVRLKFFIARRLGYDIFDICSNYLFDGNIPIRVKRKR